MDQDDCPMVLTIRLPMTVAEQLGVRDDGEKPRFDRNPLKQRPAWPETWNNGHEVRRPEQGMWLKGRADSTEVHSDPRNEKRLSFTEKTAFPEYWLPGQDSNLRPIGYECPIISTGLGLCLHPLGIQGRVSGAS